MSDMMTRIQELGRLFWRSARESGEAAAEAIEHRAQIQRLALQIRRLDRERSDLIRQIGGKVYSLHGRGKVRNQDVLGDCVRVDAIIAEIGTLRQEIERVRAASLEKGIEVPILEDEAPLTDEEVGAAPTAVKPAGTVGQQHLPDEGVGKASEGRVEFDESGQSLQCAPGPSQGVDDAEACAVPTVGQQDMPDEELPKSFEGKDEWDNSSEPNA